MSESDSVIEGQTSIRIRPDWGAGPILCLLARYQLFWQDRSRALRVRRIQALAFLEYIRKYFILVFSVLLVNLRIAMLLFDQKRCSSLYQRLIFASA